MPAGTLYFENRPPAGSTLLGKEQSEESPLAIAPVGPEPNRTTSSASASEHVGKVVGIADGDTFTLLVDKEQYRIRLAEMPSAWWWLITTAMAESPGASKWGASTSTPRWFAGAAPG
jgi:hypothetical protein